MVDRSVVRDTGYRTDRERLVNRRTQRRAVGGGGVGWWLGVDWGDSH